jgi:dipeptidase
MEIIGKGEYELGAVWVARRVPAGYVCAHANQARIRTFPLDNPEDTLYSPDVISFAKKIGLYPADAPDSSFSFSDVYDPVTFDGARFCEARVWSFFRDILGDNWAQQYLDYAQGYNLTNRMPLFIQPPEGKKISLSDSMSMMRSHYEETNLDMTGKTIRDVGAYTYSAYRAHPLTWQSNVSPTGEVTTTSHSYFHERPIATPQTGWNFIAQSRSWMPSELAGLIWFGVDDSSTTVRSPVYGSARNVPKSFAGKGPQDGVPSPMMKFSFDSAFYVFNLVANWVYSRWDLIYPDVLNSIHKEEQTLLQAVQDADRQALSIYNTQGIDSAIRYVTDFSVRTGDSLVQRWLGLFGELFVKYRDGYVITENKDSSPCGCNAASAGYPQQWYDRIVQDTGNHYAKPISGNVKNVHLAPVPKSSLKAFN